MPPYASTCYSHGSERATDPRFHSARPAFASHLAIAGVDITTVKELLGHKSQSMTLRYSYLAPSHDQRAVGVLDEN